MSRRRVLGFAAAATPLAMVGRPLGHIGLAMLNDGGRVPEPAPGFVEDASRLESVRADVRVLPRNGALEALRDLLAEARAANRAVAIAGARHTMGGQTSLEGALVVDTAGLATKEFHAETGSITVGAGARWADVLDFLEPFGKSVAIMQSNSTFSVGGSMGANAHGWQHDRPPLGSSIVAFRLMLADGTVVPCSRTENRELFGLVLGGYGLLGVVLDVDLEVVDDEVYVAERHLIGADAYPDEFARLVHGRTDVGMAYGRLAVDPDRFLGDAILTAYRRDGTEVSSLPALAQAPSVAIERAVFRGSIGSDYGKHLRWVLESRLGGEAGARTSRSRILSEPVSRFGNRDPTRTDILQEYFVPPRSFAAFLARMRRAIPGRECDLINVTVRNVLEDHDAVLRYATESMFSLVLLFNMPRTREADDALGRLGRELLDAAIDLGGRHYLPYRLYATREQVARAYPQLSALLAEKRRYDPGRVFQNHFFAKYGMD